MHICIRWSSHNIRLISGSQKSHRKLPGRTFSKATLANSKDQFLKLNIKFWLIFAQKLFSRKADDFLIFFIFIEIIDHLWDLTWWIQMRQNAWKLKSNVILIYFRKTISEYSFREFDQHIHRGSARLESALSVRWFWNWHGLFLNDLVSRSARQNWASPFLHDQHYSQRISLIYDAWMERNHEPAELILVNVIVRTGISMKD
jgi:hypothetical protein